MSHLDEFLLQEYADQELDEQQRQMVEAHLAACAACQNELAEVQTLFTTIETLPEEALTVDLSERVVAEIGQQVFWRRWSNPILMLQIAIFFVMVLILWPTIQNVLQTSNQAVQSTLAAWSTLQILSIGDGFSRVTAVWEQIEMSRPIITLSNTLWYSLLAGALLLWLAGNRLIFSDTPNNQGGQHG